MLPIYAPTKHTVVPPRPRIGELMQEAIALNTAGAVYKEYNEYRGSATEKAILEWGVEKLGMDFDKFTDNSTFSILNVEEGLTYLGVKRAVGRGINVTLMKLITLQLTANVLARRLYKVRFH